MSTGIVTRRKSAMHIDNSYGIDVVTANTNLVSKRVLKGEPFSTQIVCDEGYSVYEITIKMGGVDITSTAYDPTYNMITIPSVTDDVEIECYAMHTMPSDYVRVDGIKNPSNAYLDTGYKVTPNDKVSLKVYLVKSTSGYTYPAASKSPGATVYAGSGWYIHTQYMFMCQTTRTNNTTIWSYVGGKLNTIHELIADYYKNEHTVVGETTKSFNERKTETDYNNTNLFSREGGNDAANTVGQIIYYFKVYDYSTTSYVRYYIPCINDSNVAGFWDAARGVFQGSSNSTAFEACYTQSGLVFQLDGINKGATADAWTDLVGGYVFANNGAISQDNGWQIDNGKYLKRAPGISMDIHNNYTVEVCVTPTSAPPHMVFILNNNSSKNQPLFMVNTGNIVTFIQMTRTCTFPSYAANNSHCISINYNRGCHNGLIVTNYGSSDYWNSNSDESFIGRRNSGSTYPFKGVIHAIRIYNRRLTLEEMKFNQRIDNKRFNLGLTI